MTEPVASSLSHSTTRQISTAGRTDGWIRLCLAALLGCALSASATRADETVVVDFGVDCGPVTYRGSGFLHGMSTTEPPSRSSSVTSASAMAAAAMMICRRASRAAFSTAAPDR